MACLTVGGEVSDYEMWVRKGHVQDQDGVEDGFFGKLSTIKCDVEPSEGYKFYRIRVEFNPERPKSRGRKFSRGGFWAGVYDRNEPMVENKLFTSCEMVEERTGFQIDIAQWKWGTKPEIAFRRDRNAEMTKRIFLTFACRPFFDDASEEGESITARFTLTGWKDHGGREHELSVIDVKYSHSEDRGSADDARLEFFQDYGAFNLVGKGNSVHPKQLYTCNAVKHIITTEFQGKRKINIGYIGPDTTENLRSVIRLLTDDNDLRDKTYKLHVLFEEEWDIPAAVINFQGTDYDLDLSPIIKPNKIFVSKFLSNNKKRLDLDILIATYVGPWAVFTSQESKQNYEQLLNRIVTPKTKFITVDPSDAKNSVVSHCKKTEIYGDTATLTGFYNKELQFDSEKIPWMQGDSPMVNVRLWTRGVNS